MRTIPGLRNLVLAAAAAVVATAGAVVVLSQPEDTTRKITGTADSAPGLAWSTSAAGFGRAGAEFRDPRAGTEFETYGTGFVDGGDTLVTVLGVPDDGYLRDPVLVGIDADTGAKRWQTPAADLTGCGSTPVDGQVVCFSSDRAFVGYDLTTGDATRTPTKWFPFAIATLDDRVYVAEGDVESDDVRVHAGTLADPDAYWSRAFDMGTSWEELPFDALDVSHGQGVFTLGADIAGFDLASGKPTWTTTQRGYSDAGATSGALLVRPRTEWGGHEITGSDLIDRTGRTIATSNSTVTQTLSIDLPTDDTVPVLLGDSGYDRRTGSLLWTSSDLISAPRETDATTGTAVAIFSDVALLQDTDAHTTTGLDLRTGHRLWRTDTTRLGMILGWDGHTVVLSDYTGLWAIAPRTGAISWDIPFLAVNTDAEALTGFGQLAAHGRGHYTYASARTIIGLRPLKH
ncbi:outer membrane protein assembly factor BamB family protein [Nocardia noduli]|uniref:outer membrane protein assembly factor BamB family protein n=1 Tax=Nocardia noduli TaxID=2815722 RepID=UPI001C241FEE|nr:PQQ-binding-like beta-propeller repeat protein [Nocardia noduli]